MTAIKTDITLIAFCGLYCAACKKYINGKCPGCKENSKASWCTVRSCCIENNYNSCADCTSTELLACKKFNNTISKLIGLVLRSDRPACIRKIKTVGYENYAEDMAQSQSQTIKRK
jgi:hypothetical protein